MRDAPPVAARLIKAVRTLVISDIHLGQGGGISVLTRPRPLAALLDALDSTTGWCCWATRSSCRSRTPPSHFRSPSA